MGGDGLDHSPQRLRIGMPPLDTQLAVRTALPLETAGTQGVTFTEVSLVGRPLQLKLQRANPDLSHTCAPLRSDQGRASASHMGLSCVDCSCES